MQPFPRDASLRTCLMGRLAAGHAPQQAAADAVNALLLEFFFPDRREPPIGLRDRARR